MLAKLGGLGAGVQALLAHFAIIFTFQYFWMYGGTLQRLSNYKIDRNYIETHMKFLKKDADYISEVQAKQSIEPKVYRLKMKI